MDTASTWDSYRPAMEEVIECLRPKHVLEYGMGSSTIFLANEDVTLDSVEHNSKWYEKNKMLKSDKVNLIYEKDMNMYPLVQGRYDLYDMIFIDGVMRRECLEISQNRLTESGVVILHDAERPAYRQYVQMYKHNVYRDDGHTVILFNSDLINL